MAIDKHPSRHPTPPAKPPAARQTVGESGQEGVVYGHRHELKIKDPSASELSHHFKSHKAGKEQSQEPKSHKEHASRPGDENNADEPG